MYKTVIELARTLAQLVDRLSSPQRIWATTLFLFSILTSVLAAIQLSSYLSSIQTNVAASPPTNSEREVIRTAVFGITALLTTMVAMLFYLREKKESAPDVSALRREKRNINIVQNYAVDNRDILSSHETIKEEIVKSLSQETIESIAKQWLQETGKAYTREGFVGAVRLIGRSMQQRLIDEVAALGRRANLNLVLGFGVSVFGFGLLGLFVYTTTVELNTPVVQEVMYAVGLRLTLRLSMVLFIEVFAYFFLRLYRYSIFEMKYFQNEITSVQFRLAALEIAFASDDKKLVDKSCLEMLKSERNFILKKGESTLSVMRDKIEQDYDSKIAHVIEKIFDASVRKTSS
jgi:hypothetical protein